MRQKSMLNQNFSLSVCFSAVVDAILLKIQTLRLKMLTNDCRVMLNSSSKFKSLGKREDFTFKCFESFVAAEIIPGKESNRQTSFS